MEHSNCPSHCQAGLICRSVRACVYACVSYAVMYFNLPVSSASITWGLTSAQSWMECCAQTESLTSAYQSSMLLYVVCLSQCPCCCMSVSVSMLLYFCLSAHAVVCLSQCPCCCMSVSVSMLLYVCLSVHAVVCLSQCPCCCMSVSVSGKTKLLICDVEMS